MRPEDSSSPSDPRGPVLNYYPLPRRPTGRERLASALAVVGVLAAMLAAFAILLTIEMLFLILVDAIALRRLQAGSISYLAVSGISSLALVAMSIYANRLSLRK